MRNKSSKLAGAIALLFFVPFFASALTTNELAAQIQGLLAQVARLQEQLKSLQGTSVTPVSIGNAQKGCPALFRNLSFGAQGSDVLSLQQFLTAQNLLGAGASNGYFDAATEQAVQQLQIRYGVVVSGTPTTTGYGMVGPRTRSLIALNCNIAPTTTGSCPLAQPPTTSCLAGWQANTDSAGCVTSYRCSVPLLPATPTTGSCTAIALQCPSGTYDQVGPNCSHTCIPNTQQSGSFSAFPTSGALPLEVTFVRQNTSGSYSVDFGDGTVSPFPYNTANPGTFHDRVGYVYRNAGTYYARLLGACMGDSFACSALPNGGRPVLGTVTITVGGSTNTGTLSASPSSGNAPLAVNFSGSVNSAGYSIDFGDGTLSGDVGCAHGGCPSTPSSSAVNVNHTYSSNGTYVAKLRQHFQSNAGNCNGVDCNVVGTATVTVGSLVTSCPVYSQPLCSSTQHLVGGAYNSSTGCYGAPQCVAN